MIEKNKKTKIVLLDSHAIIHRAYHALPEFSTTSGIPTGALFGLSTMIISTIAELKPDYIIGTFDLPKPTFRHEAYDDYKGGRAKTDEALKDQLQTAREIYDAFSIPYFAKEGYEADDILGTLAIQLKKNPNNEIYIATGDMDTLQLADENSVKIFTLKKGIKDTIIYDKKAVLDRFGFGPEHIIDYKGLAGDPSDNIPGIKGIGIKTATNLIKTFGSIDDIYNYLEKNEDDFKSKAKITSRILNLLIDGKEEAFFSKELATIKTNVPDINFKLPKKTFSETIDFSKTGEIFRKFQFRSLNERLQKALGVEVQKTKTENFDKNRTEELKLAVSLLNPNITEPTIDDILIFGKNQKEADINISNEISKKELDFVWNEIEIPILPIIKKMTEHGFKIDKNKLQKISKKLKEKITKFEEKIFLLAGKKFNVKSTKQLSEILFNDLKIPTIGLKKTPKGVVSTKESELQKIKDKHEIIPLILEHREASKIISTYTDNLIELLDSNNYLHPTFLQLGTTTGRMSSKNPNIQNIPTSGQYGPLIRTAFVSSENNILVSFDYSQIELRVAAILSNDEKLSEVFYNNQDIHEAVSIEIFGDNSKENRRKAKIINFGILYGMGASSLRKNLGDDTTPKEAREYIDKFFETYQNLSKYLEDTKKFVRENGYSKTLFGRRRNFPDINSKVPFLKSIAERMAINTPIQGTATGDIIKIAMNDIQKYITKNKLENAISFLAQVHDELIFEISEKKQKKIIPEIQKIMENVLKNTTYNNISDKQKNFPLKVAYTTGKDWSKLK